GAGLSNVELSARMRYEISRKFAPYLGYVWERSFDGTADFRRIRGERPGEHRFLAGLRLWW
ncbi:copper resistance protein B, partial [Acinetobacter baumannii]